MRIRFHQHLRDGFGVLRGEHLVAELDELAVEAIQAAGSPPGSGCPRRPSRCRAGAGGTVSRVPSVHTLRELQAPDPCEDSAWRIGHSGGALTFDFAGSSIPGRAPARLHCRFRFAAGATAAGSLGRRSTLQPHWNRRGRWDGAWLARARPRPRARPARSPAAARAGAGSARPHAAPVGLDRLLKLPAAPSQAPSERARRRHEGRVARALQLGARRSATPRRRRSRRRRAKLGEAAGGRRCLADGAARRVEGRAPATLPSTTRCARRSARQREELARSERHLKDLTIEADLAGVPASWRE